MKQLKILQLLYGPNKKCFSANSFIAKVLNYIFMEHNAKSVIKPENAIL